MNIVALDFETAGIEPRPKYPPKPVGFALHEEGVTSRYYSWGHPIENNTTYEAAKAILAAVLSQPDYHFVCHNTSFDAAVMIEMGLDVPWDRMHDTMVLAFLVDPFGELSLKPLCQQLLGMEPEERDAVKDWLIRHGVCRDTKGWGAYICKAPGGLVGEYAIGDVVRTVALFKHLYPIVVDAGMKGAYEREMKLMPVLMEMERRGIKLDVKALREDSDFYFDKLEWLDEQICNILGTQVDVDSNAQLADAIEAAGLSKGFMTTPTGLRSTSKESLIGAVDHPTLLGHLLVRGSIATCLRTFFQPWLEQGNKTGRLYMQWNQVRNYSDTGARTGRISSSPNLQNIPVEWEGLKAQLINAMYVLPFELPSMRKYIIADNDHVLIGRDYSAQEMKLLAHFTDGGMLRSLKADPTKDVHMIAADIAGITRKVAKTLGFAVLYGAGVARVAESLSVTVNAAQIIKDKYLKALPEIKEFQSKLNALGKMRSYTETIGGRHYYSQKPAVVNGAFRSFEYKLPNYKIQGSAADQTKEAMLRYASKTKHGQLLLTVHDQLVVQCPIEHQDEEAAILEWAMNGSFQDILKYQVTSDESRGTNFAQL